MLSSISVWFVDIKVLSCAASPRMSEQVRYKAFQRGQEPFHGRPGLGQPTFALQECSFELWPIVSEVVEKEYGKPGRKYILDQRNRNRKARATCRVATLGRLLRSDVRLAGIDHWIGLAVGRA